MQMTMKRLEMKGQKRERERERERKEKSRAEKNELPYNEKREGGQSEVEEKRELYF